MLKNRIQNGIDYFWDIKPSEWKPINTVHLKKFLLLVKELMSGEQQELLVKDMTSEEVEDTFK